MEQRGEEEQGEMGVGGAEKGAGVRGEGEEGDTGVRAARVREGEGKAGREEVEGVRGARGEGAILVFRGVGRGRGGWKVEGKVVEGRSG